VLLFLFIFCLLQIPEFDSFGTARKKISAELFAPVLCDLPSHLLDGHHTLVKEEQTHPLY